jgi:hypothetical protein
MRQPDQRKFRELVYDENGMNATGQCTGTTPHQLESMGISFNVASSGRYIIRLIGNLNFYMIRLEDLNPTAKV